MITRIPNIAPLAVVLMLAIAMPASAHQEQSSAASTAAECQAEWASADVNKDGNLTGDELNDYRAVLTAVDTNSDGTLSPAEFDAACREE